MKPNKLFIVIFSILLNLSFQSYSLNIFGPDGYKELIEKYNQALTNAENDPSLLKENLNKAIEILNILEKNASDLEHNNPLRAYLANTELKKNPIKEEIEGMLPKVIENMTSPEAKYVSAIYIDKPMLITQMNIKYGLMLSRNKEQLRDRIKKAEAVPAESKWRTAIEEFDKNKTSAKRLEESGDIKGAKEALTKALQALEELRNQIQSFLKETANPQATLRSIGIEVPSSGGAGVPQVSESKLKEVLLDKIDELNEKITALESKKPAEKKDEGEKKAKDISETGTPAGVAAAEARRHDELRRLIQEIDKILAKKTWNVAINQFFKEDLSEVRKAIELEIASETTSQKIINALGSIVHKIEAALEHGYLRNPEVDEFIKLKKREAGIF